MIDKSSSCTLRTEIRQVLLNVWDPVGIRDEPNSQNEYDSYIGRISDLLQNHATEAEVMDYLLWAVRENMGFDAATHEHMRTTATALRKIEIPS